MSQAEFALLGLLGVNSWHFRGGLLLNVSFAAEAALLYVDSSCGSCGCCSWLQTFLVWHVSLSSSNSLSLQVLKHGAVFSNQNYKLLKKLKVDSQGFAVSKDPEKKFSFIKVIHKKWHRQVNSLSHEARGAIFNAIV